MEKDRVDYPVDSAGWDRWYADPSYGWTPASAAVREELGRVPSGRALDLGVGDGRHAVWLAGRGWQVDAVDFSPEAIRIGREQCGSPPPSWKCSTSRQTRPTHG
ncbi:class I SAM-dependent methyltransferase [Arthrobacter sp. TMN-50]